jgi:glycosyltransferase involved in cell wall biosynthesis
MTRLIAALGDPLMKDQSWHYSAIGDGPERQHCFELSRELGIAPRVSWLGARPAHDAFSEADLMILPSEFEGRPLVLLEALDSGVPILASDIPAHREVLGAGSPALLPAEVGAWPQRISQVIESESERRNIREATRGLLPDAPQQIQAQRYLELYQQAMS